jgi:hypothetical protein
MGYVLAVRANHAVTTGSGRTVTVVGSLSMIPARAWHRMRTCGSSVAPSSRRPAETGRTGRAGRPGDAATSTAPVKLTDAGTPMPRHHSDDNELQPP